MRGFPLAVALFLGLAASSNAESLIKGKYLDEDLPQSCGVFRGEHQHCSATIVGPRQALTSAHCHDEAMDELLSSTTGALNASRLYTLRCGKNGEKRWVWFAVKETDYKPPTDTPRDRMLLAVTEKFTAKPMELAGEEFFKKITNLDAKPDCKIAGWGLDNEEKSGKLRVASLAHVHQPEDKEHLIYGFEKNHSASGDSGGTLYCKIGGVWKLAGVISGTWESLGYNVAALARVPAETLLKPYEKALKSAESRKKSDKLPTLAKRAASAAAKN